MSKQGLSVAPGVHTAIASARIMKLSREESQAPEQLLEFAEVLVSHVTNLEAFDRVCRTLWPDCLIKRQPQVWRVMPFGKSSTDPVRDSICFCFHVAGF